MTDRPIELDPSINMGSDALPVIVSIDTATLASGGGDPFSMANMLSLAGQFVDIEGMTEAATPEYDTITVMGRAEAIKSFATVSNREVSLMFSYRAHAAADQPFVVQNAKWFDALKYPYVINGISYPPPAVFLTVGGLLSMRAIITNADIRWIGPFNPGTLTPHGVDIHVTFTSVMGSAYQFYDLGLTSPNRYVVAARSAPATGVPQ